VMKPNRQAVAAAPISGPLAAKFAL